MRGKNAYTIAVVLLTAVILVLSGCHHRQYRWSAGEADADRLTAYLTKELDLNEAQKAQLSAAVAGLMAKKKSMLDRDCV